MPTCNVIGCGCRGRENHPTITLHQLPANKQKRKIWLEAIGVENLKMSTKIIHICSLHFEEKCFNRTLNKVLLRDDASPSRNLLPQNTRISYVLIQNNQNETIASSECSAPNMIKAVFVPIMKNQPRGISKRNGLDFAACTSAAPDLAAGTSATPDFAASTYTTPDFAASTYTTPDFATSTSARLDFAASTSATPVFGASTSATSEFAASTSTRTELAASISTTPDLSVHTFEIINKLKDKCQKQSKKIKRLNEKVRRQGKKIAHFSNIIKDLKERNLLNSESQALLEECAGLPVKRQYSEEIRKFALTLNFFSPKAYEFVRSTYKSNLLKP